MSQASSPEDLAREREQQHLDDIQERLAWALKEAERRLRQYADEIKEQKTYLWESRDEMDHIEKVSSRESIEQMSRSGDNVLKQRDKLRKLQRAPYFGRVDFGPDASRAEPVYIGVHHFHDQEQDRTRIHDWRAPVSSLFYDYETGPAAYTAPTGAIRGEITRKRQFRIRGRRLERMLDSSVNVVDDVLQEVLGEASDESMKNIVATIQRDQNAIIRNDEAPVVIIQGVAGSGKTSIALHRIAFLLYRFKDTLSSRDMMIISPNQVFAGYIGNVLPELGEEAVNEIRMEDLAERLLEGQYRFETFFEQTAALLEKDDAAMRERIRRKASLEFLRQLDRYAEQVAGQRFAAEDIWVARRLVPGHLLEELFGQFQHMNDADLLRNMERAVAQKVAFQYRFELTTTHLKQVREALRGMLRQTTLRQAYQAFFDWLGEPELFQPARRRRLEYADVFPLIYLKLKRERLTSPYRHVKHLLVDEMQDYSPVQYAVLNRLFPCNKTILGDARQSINPYGSSTLEQIREAMQGATCMTLNQSYRSTWEITRFTQRISPNPDLLAMERHGDEPQVIRCATRTAELVTIEEQAWDFLDSPHNALAIICKTNKQARRYADQLSKRGLEPQLLDETSGTYHKGIVVCTAQLSKGLEFDRVIVPAAEQANYQTKMDRNMLYVACTRAMHRLTLIHVGAPSALF
ncbi:MAG: AAA family ATPase [Thioalkalivibrio sp.]|nr:AAA family ATPase [Thioalkalivibrio sp.]